MQGVFAVHRKFTEWNRAGIEIINQMVYNKLKCVLDMEDNDENIRYD